MSGLDRAMSGKVAVITGASTPKGIGAAIARRYAAEGASLFLAADGPVEGLASVTADCRAAAAEGGVVESGLFDLSAPDKPEAMIDAALEKFGRVDVLVNNAAIRDNKSFGTFNRTEFDKIVSVNLSAAFFASQAVLPAMRKQGGGRIIHIASQFGSVAFGKRAVYGLTKAALIHLTKTMAYELGSEGIIVNSISPGPVKTQPILDRLEQDPEYEKTRTNYLRAGRFGEPEEIAELAYFLAVTKSTFMQGTDLLIDGGYTTH
ncbi:MAG: SDR family NAD(P)-dependent oxidoreductase [Alphaproteobacteria bacterium]|jgi:NAD(P)-dependent dehydrogenase (short-subunit alcohol dehydrogenase family)